MKKIKNIAIVGILIQLIMMLFPHNINAASASISANSTAYTNEAITISVSGTGVQWNLSLKVNGQEIATSRELDNYQSNLNISFSGKYTPTSTGTLNVTLTGSVTDFNSGATITNFSGKSITVNNRPVSPTPTPTPTPSTGGGTSGGNSTSKPTPTPTAKEPKFTSVDKTVYATGNINLRASWSTSSSATRIQKGTELKLTGISSETVNGYVWYRVNYQGATKYVAKTLVTETNPNGETEENKPEELVEEPVEEEPVDIISEEIFGLESIRINSEELKDFKVDQYYYKYDVKNVDKLEIVAKANEEGATVEILGNENFSDGENIVTIIVVSKDGEKTATYQIEVNKSTEIIGTLNMKNLLTYVALAFVILVALIILIVTLVKSNRLIEDDEYEPEEVENNSDMEIDEETQDVISDYKTRRKGGKHSK